MPATRNTLLKDYFTFSKKERRAVILLAVAAIIFSLLPSLFPVLVKGESDFIVDVETQQKLAAMRTNEKESISVNEEENGDWYEPARKSYPEFGSPAKGELFVFDPNTATAEEWQRLGVRNKTIQTILKYRSKGGSFKKPEDISRIYGLSVKEVDRLLPFVKIESKPIAPPVNDKEQYTSPAMEPRPSYSENKSKPIDINKADTAEWKSLKGIGSFYAKKIVGFREKLGGFYSVQQVAETYGLPDSTFQTIKPFLLIDPSSIRQINLNTTTIEELKAHPYIKGYLANAIVNYRIQHGPFSSVEQLRQIGAVDEDIYQKIAPYLAIQ